MNIPEPVTRIEQYLYAIAGGEGGGGGGGGVTGVKGSAESSYRKGNVNMSPADIGIVAATEDSLGLVKPDNETLVVGEDGTLRAEGAMSKLSSDLTAAVEVGGIGVGDHYEEGTSLETVVRDMLEPTLYPTFTAPSATLSATGAKLLEKGGTLATTMTVAFSRGAISPAYGTDGYRSGAATGYTLNGGVSQASNSFSVSVTEAQKTYQATVAYAAGEQPKDSKGGNYDSPLAAGSVNSNTISYEFVPALWSNVANIATIAKEALVSKSAKVKQFNFPASTVANPEVFDVPSSWTVTTVEVLNTLSNQWETATAQFTVTNVSHDDAAGDPVSYKRYTCNLGMAMGARNVRVKWS